MYGRLRQVKNEDQVGFKLGNDNDTEFDDILQQLSLSRLEETVLKLRLNGYSLLEISRAVKEPIGLISQKLMNAKAVLYGWFEKNQDIHFILSIIHCPLCDEQIMLASTAEEFCCDACGTELNRNVTMAGEIA